ncbi:MAG TPA: alpha/beta hydrolase [Roseiflexaceae bacterium]|nr:alpha/beta hydrolase [Roseiflexaceae bacterium]
MTTAPQTGYAPVNGLSMYYEIHGDGAPLVLLHGGFGSTGMFAELLPALAQKRRVIAVDLQGHGRTGDIDRPLSLEQMGDDIAALVRHLGLDQVDLIGYSMGGGAALRAAVQHPELVGRLVVVSIPFRRNGWYPDVRANMDQMGAHAAAFMQDTPMYQSYAAIAPDPAAFPVLLDKMGDMVRRDYDWTADVAALRTPTLLVFGDADGVPPSHAAEFFALLGGGQCDGGWDGSGMPASRLAILPATTHYNALESPLLLGMVEAFLG